MDQSSGQKQSTEKWTLAPVAALFYGLCAKLKGLKMENKQTERKGETKARSLEPEEGEEEGGIPGWRENMKEGKCDK